MTAFPPSDAPASTFRTAPPLEPGAYLDRLNELDALLGLRADPAAEAPVGEAAFYWRVSTEDNQDPQASRARQLHRARELVAPLGARLVREYSDVGISRSMPWTARPGAAQLLRDLKDPDRGFRAVVVGEGDRSFFGDQLAMIWPQFAAAGVDLYIPDIGGRYDAQHLLDKAMMGMVGLFSEQEVDTIRRRVRETMARAVVEQGRFMGGRAPYGYRVVDGPEPHPHPRKAADGRMTRVMEIDSAAGDVVKEIFRLYLLGAGTRAIAQELDRRGIPCPSAHNPDQNRHRTGAGWSHIVIGSILDNVRYTGFEIWGASQRHRPYLDPDNPSLGWVLRFRPAPADRVVRSRERTHAALVSIDTYLRTQRMRRARTAEGLLPGERTGRTSKYPSALRGRIRCAACGRKMAASPRNGAMRFTCRARDLPAGPLRDGHPASVYVTEASLLQDIDAQLKAALTPAGTAALVVAIASAGESAEERDERLADAHRRLNDATARIQHNIEALDAGAISPTIVERLNDAERDKAAAATELAAASVCSRPTTEAATAAVQQLSAAYETDSTDVLAERFAITVAHDPATRTNIVRIDVAALHVQLPT